MSQKTLLLWICGVILAVAAAFGGGFYLGQTWQKPATKPETTPPWLAKNPPPPPAKEETIPEQRLTFYDNLTEKGGKTAKSSKSEPDAVKEKGPAATKESKGDAAAGKTVPAKEKTETKIKPKETTTAKSETTPAVKKGNYFIHLASLKSQEGAESLASRLRKKGYNVKINTVDLGEKGIWHRLLINGYASKEEAERVAESLRSKEGLSPVVRAGKE